MTAAYADELGIPHEAVRKLMTEIGDRAFGDFSLVVELSLPNWLIRIGSFAVLCPNSTSFHCIAPSRKSRTMCS
jgi:hypothetical protein